MSCKNGIADVFGSLESIEVYPNPTEGISTIEIKGTIQNGTVKVMNYLGQVIQVLNLNNRNKLPIDLSENAPGVYMLEISNNEGAITRKLIKK